MNALAWMDEYKEDFEKASRDLVSFVNSPYDDAIAILRKAIYETITGKEWGSLVMRSMGIVITEPKIKNQVKLIAVKYNHGRRKKVSLKRPGPRMSRAQLSAYKAKARMMIVFDES